MYQTIWIGDELRKPVDCIQSWGDDVKVYGNKDLTTRSWRLAPQMQYYIQTNQLNGTADCMRWELLYQYGGTFVDADSVKLRDLPDDFNELPCIAAWEQESERPGLIACGYLKFPPKHPFVNAIIEHILEEPMEGKMAWEVVGPMAITKTFYKEKPDDLTILPSHFFFPRHLTGKEYSGTLKYADQKWGSTFNSY
jgi:mannosyltransferase OCH1-like enzyme